MRASARYNSASSGRSNPIRVRHFDGDGPTQLFVPCQVNEAEAPSSQQPFNPVAADSFRQFWMDGFGDRGLQIDERGRRQGIGSVHAGIADSRGHARDRLV